MATGRICAVDGCGNKYHAHGYCARHNYKFVTYGDPLAGRTSASPGEPLRWIEENAGHQGDECLPWPFECSHWGYGVVKHNGQKRVASRVMCERAHGPAPSPKWDAAHSCHNPPCCNPQHLRWATRRENNDDKIENGTVHRGERTGVAKLTEAGVIEIRRLAGTVLQQDLAERFGVTQTVISRVINRKRWGWVSDGSELRGDGSPVD